MGKTIAELLEDQQSDTVTVRGRIVRSLVRLPVREGNVITIEREQVGSPRPQALKLAVNRGALRVNGLTSDAIALWSHTSPEIVDVEVVGNRATTLEVWNAWLMGEVDSAWIGNAGIVAKATDRGHRLGCSDGVGEPSFTDLVVHLTVRSS